MNAENWQEVDGDNTLALDWPLNENSHVWEIGGFEGRWVQQIWDKFHCNITVFEPQPWAVEKLNKRFGDIDKIDIHPYGLWMEDAEFRLGDFFTDGASIIKGMNDMNAPYCQFKNMYIELTHFIDYIDVGLMNIEGVEYVLIPNLINTNFIQYFKNFWCQFHPGLAGDSPDEKFDKICEEMEATHEMIWNCFPTAVAWRRR